MRTRSNELAAVFLVAMATLLFEISVTKIFEYSVWANYAYLVISTAMFGLGFSGVLLTRWPRMLQWGQLPYLTITSLGTGVTLFAGFLTLNHVPIHLPDAPNGWARESVNLSAVFIALALPFTLFGLLMGYILHQRARAANVYYFADLIGAGVGALLLVPLISHIEPQGLVALCALACIAGAALFALPPSRGHGWQRAGVVTVLAATVYLAVEWPPRAAAQIPLRVHVEKREYKHDLRRHAIETSVWTALSRVDIASFQAQRKQVWISGGVNESTIYHFDGPIAELGQRRERVLASARRHLDHHALPHLFRTNHTVCVIGTSGGADSVWALMCGARNVVGVEMDPGIARLVTEDYREFAGGLFTDGDYSELVIDEGRSYLRRTDRKFDVIHQINNFTPIAFQNGVLNLSETYLLTVESFRDFYDSLSEDGILCITRWGTIRLLSLAVEMFREMGMTPEEYSKHLVVCEGATYTLNTFMMKKTPFTPAETDTLFEFYSETRSGKRVLYAPYRTDALPTPEKNIYYLMATAEDPNPYRRIGCFSFAPTRDDKPFFNHFQVLGAEDRDRHELELLPAEIREVVPRSKVDRRIPRGDLPPFIVLLEALVLASVFFGLPLLSKGELRQTLQRERKTLGYFACLGAGFIFIEICLIQRLVLFLGAPVYSIALVLASLLIAAGLGSLVSGRFRARYGTMRWMLPAVGLALLLIHFSMPALTRAFLGTTFPVRVLVAGTITGVAGFMMGMPMPTGIRFLKEENRNIIPWAWAINGYFTVIGTAAAVILAVNLGFSTVFILAATLYIVAPAFLRPRRPT